MKLILFFSSIFLMTAHVWAADVSDPQDADDQMVTYVEAPQSPHRFELAPEVYYYKYTERIGVKVDGMKGGLVGAYQYRFGDPADIQTFDDLFHISSVVNVFRFEGRASYGKVDYEGSGTWGGIPDWNFETRGLFAFELPVRNTVTFIPFSGLGYRYLYNDFSKYPAGYVDGQLFLSGYDRESNYVYIPLGMDTKIQFDNEWSLTLKGEFDFFIWGKQISHLEDMVDENDVNAGVDKLENKQEDGIGWRASARLTRSAGRIDVFVEPFIRYWHIDDSEVELVTYGGVANCTNGLCDAGQEPDNKTWEYGVNLGAQF